MITLYTGTCGSGKSVHQAQLVYWQLRLDKPCVCNYDVNHDMFPDLIDNLVIQDDSLGSMAFRYANQFIDIGFIVTVLTAWFPMFALAWILQMLWSWAKLKNKG